MGKSLLWTASAVGAGFLLATAARMPPSVGHGFVYWAQSPRGAGDERGTIVRARITNELSTDRVVTGAVAPAGVAVDGRYLYWANYGSGTIGRARLDGSHVDERFISAGDEYSVIGVAVDRRHISWTHSGTDPNVGWIGRANLDGSNVERRFIKAGDLPIGVTIAGARLYWAHREVREVESGWRIRYAIGRADVDGTDAERDFIRVPTAIDGVAATDRYVYWSNQGEHVLGRANVDGTDVHQRCIGVQMKPLETVPEGLATDGDHVYWSNYPADTISRASVDGSEISRRFITTTGVPEGVVVTSRGADEHSACEDVRMPLLLGPTNQSLAYYAAGWGEVAPAVVDNGGAAASGRIFEIHWLTWGGKRAVGRGLNPTYTPHGGYYRHPVVIELRASNVRDVLRTAAPYTRG